MRPIRITVNAAKNSQWIPIDYIAAWFGVGLGVIPWSTASGLSATVQHTFDDIGLPAISTDIVTISRTTTTATVTDKGPDGLGHGLSTNDNVIIFGTGSTVLDSPKTTVGNGDLGWDVTVVDANTYTYTVANSGATAATGTVRRLRVFPGPISAVSARTDGNYAYPVRAIRLKVATLSAGAVDFVVLQGSAR